MNAFTAIVAAVFDDTNDDGRSSLDR